MKKWTFRGFNCSEELRMDCCFLLQSDRHVPHIKSQWMQSEQCRPERREIKIRKLNVGEAAAHMQFHRGVDEWSNYQFTLVSSLHFSCTALVVVSTLVSPHRFYSLTHQPLGNARKFQFAIQFLSSFLDRITPLSLLSQHFRNQLSPSLPASLETGYFSRASLHCCLIAGCYCYFIDSLSTIASWWTKK